MIAASRWRHPLERLECRDTPASSFVDPTFGTNGTAALDGFTAVGDVQVLADGRVLVAGTVGAGEAADFGIARLTADGRPDPTFGTSGRTVVPFDLPGAGQGADGAARVVLRPDGRLVVVGGAANGDGAAFVAVAQLTAAGQLDLTFGGGDGKVTFGYDNDPNPINRVDDVGVLGDGSIVITGGKVLNPFSSDYAAVAARLTPAGQLDPAYGTAGVKVLGDGTSRTVALNVDSLGRVYRLSQEDPPGGSQPPGSQFTFSDYYAMRYDANGQPDPTYGTGGRALIEETKASIGGFTTVRFSGQFLDDGTLLFISTSSSQPGTSSSRTANGSLSRFRPDGSKDTEFGNGGVASSILPPFDVGPTGRFIGTPGPVTPFNGNSTRLTALTPAGRLDTTFGVNGIVSVGDRVPSPSFALFAQQNDATVLVVGNTLNSAALSVTRFDVTMREPPTLAAPTAVTAPGGTTSTFTLLVGDTNTPGDELQVTAAAPGTPTPTVLPAGSVAVTGTGATRTLTLTPPAGVVGDTTLRITVTDSDNQVATATVLVTVGRPGNERPTVAVSGPTTELTSGTPATYAVAVGDAETAADALQVTASTDNAAVFPDGTFVLTGTGATRTLTLTPAAARSGPATVSLVVRDADGRIAMVRFAVTVSAAGPPATANTAPTLAASQTNVALTTGTAGTVQLTLGDAETAADALVVTAAVDDTTLFPTGSTVFPAGSVVVTGTGATRTLTLTPAAGVPGFATVRVTVRDADGGFASTSVVVAVREQRPNQSPTIVAAPVSLALTPGETRTILLAVGDTETEAGALSVTAAADDVAVFPAGTVVVSGTGGTRTVTLTAAAKGSATVVVTVRDADGGVATTEVPVVVGDVPGTPGRAALVGVPQFAAGPDAGGGSAVTFYNADGSVRQTLTVLAGAAGGVRVAAADVTGDGVADVVVGTGPGAAARVEVYDGDTYQRVFSVDPFEAGFTGGVFVAAGDLDGDGVAELVVTPDEGGSPRVRVYAGTAFTVLADFFGIDDPAFRGGARAAVGDLTGDGVGDLVVAAGFGGGPRVAGYDGRTVRLGQVPAKTFADFFAFEQGLRNGVYVAVGDINGDGRADVIAGGGPGGGPRVLALDGAGLVGSNALNPVANFFAGDPDNRSGVRVAVKDLDGDNRADLVVSPGAGASSAVTGYYGKNLAAGTPTADLTVDPFAGFLGGSFVG